MKLSIRFKFTIIYLCVFTAAAAAVLLLNKAYLEKYYLRSKLNSMIETAQKLSDLASSGAWSEAEESGAEQTTIEIEVSSIEENGESASESRAMEPSVEESRSGRRPNEGQGEGPFGFMQFPEQTQDTELTQIKGSLNDIHEQTGISVLLIKENGYTLSLITASGLDSNFISSQFRVFLLDSQRNGAKRDAVYSKNGLTIYKTVDSREASQCLECSASLGEDMVYYLRLPLAAIAETAELSNRFFLYGMAGALLVGAFLIFIACDRMTKPIRKLTALSKSMSELDFGVRYEGMTRDEIDDLGNNMNIMSRKLEQSLTELRAANLELKRDIDQKQKVDEMRKEFLSNVTHELKTPLALISGYAEGLMSGISDDPESTRDYCEVIMDEADKMNRMVKRLLTLNQLEFGDNQMQMERFDMTELIGGVAANSMLLAKNKGAQIRFTGTEPMMVYGDEYYLEEVITNYLTNAINHVDDEETGEKQIIISAENRSDGCYVEVFNTGSHIPEEMIDRIWEKFYKVDKARTRAYGGNGIGLSIVKAIMNSHGGTCGAGNRENGVYFWFLLPGIA